MSVVCGQPRCSLIYRLQHKQFCAQEWTGPYVYWELLMGTGSNWTGPSDNYWLRSSVKSGIYIESLILINGLASQWKHLNIDVSINRYDCYYWRSFIQCWCALTATFDRGFIFDCCDERRSDCFSTHVHVIILVKKAKLASVFMFRSVSLTLRRLMSYMYIWSTYSWCL